MTVLVAFLIFGKAIMQKYVEQLIETSANKTIETLKHKFNRTTSAYELLLRKEFDYYESIEGIYSKLIIGVQDLYASICDAYKCELMDEAKRHVIALEEMNKYYEALFALKDLHLRFEAYLPVEVWEANKEVCRWMQETKDLFQDSLAKAFDGREPEVNKEECKTLMTATLGTISIAVKKNRERLVELSTP